ncbi:MAG: hypothetical protein J7623_13780 [Chitinophaga sp.]|uniref:hypothetical protein n=1 Tax=Chitinophaga sp. TaxID=1869181 RepID=UPI001B24021E|nr:hypothetical protein [Chitinophaga sp.]MBO9729702.1 hypothetical protein [Chitinophaga sp.]
MKRFIVCNNCGTRVSGLLDQQVALDFIGKMNGELLLSEGQYGIDDKGDYYIFIGDKHHLTYHPDQNRMIGCCGPSPEGLPNLVCICKSETGREVTDCLTAHYITLYKNAAMIKEDSTGLLAEVLALPIAEETKYQYEILIQYGDTASVLKALGK